MPIDLPPPNVAIVGAGLGDPELITLKALKRLHAAEVVLYDRLVSEDLLLEAPTAELIFVGKHGDERPSWKQEDINALLIFHAQAGKRVVRLKGGDPFVFGRGGEEALALKQAAIRYEIIPGVSSALAAALYAGIPITHRHVSTSFTVLTGHEDPYKSASSLDWAALAKAETLVILMSVGRLEAITEQLLHHGRAPNTPAAMIRYASTSEQEIVEGTLENIAQHVAKAGLKAPATLVIGEVVALRGELAWFKENIIEAVSC